jgi:hypothetical protein
MANSTRYYRDAHGCRRRLLPRGLSKRERSKIKRNRNRKRAWPGTPRDKRRKMHDLSGAIEQERNI